MQAQTPTVELKHNKPTETLEGREEPYSSGDIDNMAVAPITATTVRSRKAAENIDPKNPETWGKVPRNALCPCGSGKKYKQCCGKL